MSPEMAHVWRQIHMAPAEPCDFPAGLHPPSPGHIWNVLKSSYELQGMLTNVRKGVLTCLAPRSPQQPSWLLQIPWVQQRSFQPWISCSGGLQCGRVKIVP